MEYQEDNTMHFKNAKLPNSLYTRQDLVKFVNLIVLRSGFTYILCFKRYDAKTFTDIFLKHPKHGFTTFY